MKTALLLVTIVLTVVPANSFISVKDYHDYKDQELFKIYISGVGEGFLMMNSYLRSYEKPPIYCQPGKLVMNADNYINIIESEIKRGAKQDSIIELLLLYGLIKTFPCGKSGAP
jgi:hypothetical protein